MVISQPVRSNRPARSGTNARVAVFDYEQTFLDSSYSKALEVTHELGGAGYVFWGGREGYSTL
jgi:xylose isomerase